MATARLRCNHCEQPLTFHCPESNTLCDWLACTNRACTARIYDLHRGLLQHTDGHVEAWGQVDGGTTGGQ